MKTEMKRFVTGVIVALFALTGSSWGTILTWDATNSVAGAQDGNGIWSSTTNTWWDGSQNVVWSSPGDTAVIGATVSSVGYTITLGENVSAGGLVLNEPYSINSGGGTNITISGVVSNTNYGNANATINSGLTLASDLTFTLHTNAANNGRLILNGSIGETGGSRKIILQANSSYLTFAGAGTFSGGVDYSGGSGTFSVNNDQALGTGTFIHRGGLFVSAPFYNTVNVPRTLANNIILRTPALGTLNHDFPSAVGTNALRGRISLECAPRISVGAALLRIQGVIADGTGAGAVTFLGNAGLVTLEATNTYAGTTILKDGVLRATDGVGLPTSSLLQLEGQSAPTFGTLEATGTFNRTIGASAGQVKWGSYSGGFSAAGGPLRVDLNSLNTRDNLVWGQASFVSNANNLVLNSLWADSPVEWYDNLDLSTNVGSRSFRACPI